MKTTMSGETEMREASLAERFPLATKVVNTVTGSKASVVGYDYRTQVPRLMVVVNSITAPKTGTLGAIDNWETAVVQKTTPMIRFEIRTISVEDHEEIGEWRHIKSVGGGNYHSKFKVRKGSTYDIVVKVTDPKTTIIHNPIIDIANVNDQHFRRTYKHIAWTRRYIDRLFPLGCAIRYRPGANQGIVGSVIGYNGSDPNGPMLALYPGFIRTTNEDVEVKYVGAFGSLIQIASLDEYETLIPKEEKVFADIKPDEVVENITLSSRVRGDRKSQSIVGEVEYVCENNIAIEGVEGAYAILALKGKTKVRCVGEDAKMLKEGDIVRVEITELQNDGRGVWNASMGSAPTVLDRPQHAEEESPAVSTADNDIESDTSEPEAVVEDDSTANEEVLLSTDAKETDARTMAELRWERPTTDEKLSEKTGIDMERIVEITTSKAYTNEVANVLVDSVSDSDGRYKWKNYCRMANYRGVEVPKTLARKMHIEIDISTGIVDRIQAKI